MNSTTVNEKEETKNNVEEEEPIETVTIEDDVNEDLLKWTTNKLRGFKRSNPTTPPVNKANLKPPVTKEKKTPPPSSAPTPSAVSPTSSSSPSSPAENRENVTYRNPTERTLYCHYFSNYGRCNFEERTGTACKFEHNGAPMCQSGLACQRNKCMYKHPNMDGRSMTNPFLEQNKSFSQGFNPWQMEMMNPWMNPWNMERSRR